MASANLPGPSNLYPTVNLTYVTKGKNTNGNKGNDCTYTVNPPVWVQAGSTITASGSLCLADAITIDESNFQFTITVAPWLTDVASNQCSSIPTETNTFNTDTNFDKNGYVCSELNGWAYLSGQQRDDPQFLQGWPVGPIYNQSTGGNVITARTPYAIVETFEDFNVLFATGLTPASNAIQQLAQQTILPSWVYTNPAASGNTPNGWAAGFGSWWSDVQSLQSISTLGASIPGFAVRTLLPTIDTNQATFGAYSLHHHEIITCSPTAPSEPAGFGAQQSNSTILDGPIRTEHSVLSIMALIPYDTLNGGSSFHTNPSSPYIFYVGNDVLTFNPLTEMAFLDRHVMKGFNRVMWSPVVPMSTTWQTTYFPTRLPCDTLTYEKFALQPGSFFSPFVNPGHPWLESSYVGSTNSMDGPWVQGVQPLNADGVAGMVAWEYIAQSFIQPNSAFMRPMFMMRRPVLEAIYPIGIRRPMTQENNNEDNNPQYSTWTNFMQLQKIAGVMVPGADDYIYPQWVDNETMYSDLYAAASIPSMLPLHRWQGSGFWLDVGFPNMNDGARYCFKTGDGAQLLTTAGVLQYATRYHVLGGRAYGFIWNALTGGYTDLFTVSTVIKIPYGYYTAQQLSEFINEALQNPASPYASPLSTNLTDYDGNPIQLPGCLGNIGYNPVLHNIVWTNAGIASQQIGAYPTHITQAGLPEVIMRQSTNGATIPALINVDPVKCNWTAVSGPASWAPEAGTTGNWPLAPDFFAYPGCAETRAIHAFRAGNDVVLQSGLCVIVENGVVGFTNGSASYAAPGGTGTTYTANTPAIFTSQGLYGADPSSWQIMGDIVTESQSTGTNPASTLNGGLTDPVFLKYGWHFRLDLEYNNQEAIFPTKQNVTGSFTVQNASYNAADTNPNFDMMFLQKSQLWFMGHGKTMSAETYLARNPILNPIRQTFMDGLSGVTILSLGNASDVAECNFADTLGLTPGVVAEPKFFYVKFKEGFNYAYGAQQQVVNGTMPGAFPTNTPSLAITYGEPKWYQYPDAWPYLSPHAFDNIRNPPMGSSPTFTSASGSLASLYLYEQFPARIGVGTLLQQYCGTGKNLDTNANSYASSSYPCTLAQTIPPDTWAKITSFNSATLGAMLFPTWPPYTGSDIGNDQNAQVMGGQTTFTVPVHPGCLVMPVGYVSDGTYCPAYYNKSSGWGPGGDASIATWEGKLRHVGFTMSAWVPEFTRATIFGPPWASLGECTKALSANGDMEYTWPSTGPKPFNEGLPPWTTFYYWSCSMWPFTQFPTYILENPIPSVTDLLLHTESTTNVFCMQAINQLTFSSTTESKNPSQSWVFPMSTGVSNNGSAYSGTAPPFSSPGLFTALTQQASASPVGTPWTAVPYNVVCLYPNGDPDTCQFLDSGFGDQSILTNDAAAAISWNWTAQPTVNLWNVGNATTGVVPLAAPVFLRNVPVTADELINCAQPTAFIKTPCIRVARLGRLHFSADPVHSLGIFGPPSAGKVDARGFSADFLGVNPTRDYQHPVTEIISWAGSAASNIIENIADAFTVTQSKIWYDLIREIRARPAHTFGFVSNDINGGLDSTCYVFSNANMCSAVRPIPPLPRDATYDQDHKWAGPLLNLFTNYPGDPVSPLSSINPVMSKLMGGSPAQNIANNMVFVSMQAEPSAFNLRSNTQVNGTYTLDRIPCMLTPLPEASLVVTYNFTAPIPLTSDFLTSLRFQVTDVENSPMAGILSHTTNITIQPPMQPPALGPPSYVDTENSASIANASISAPALGPIQVKQDHSNSAAQASRAVTGADAMALSKPKVQSETASELNQGNVHARAWLNMLGHRNITPAQLQKTAKAFNLASASHNDGSLLPNTIQQPIDPKATPALAKMQTDQIQGIQSKKAGSKLNTGTASASAATPSATAATMKVLKNPSNTGGVVTQPATPTSNALPTASAMPAQPQAPTLQPSQIDSTPALPPFQPPPTASTPTPAQPEPTQANQRRRLQLPASNESPI